MADTSSDPRRLAALTQELMNFSAGASARGRTYAVQGRVGPPLITAQRISAYVRGGEVYLTDWEWIEDGWDSECTCPIGGYCKHAYALACVVLGRARAMGELDDRRLETLLPRATSVDRSLPPADSIRDVGDETERSDELPESALDELRTGRHEWEREGALDLLLAHCPVQELNPYMPPFIEILREADPDLRCWRLAQEIPRLANGWLPESLKSFRDRPDLAARHQDRGRLTLAHELLSWAAQRQPDRRRSLRLVFFLERDGEGNGVLGFEVRSTTPRLSDATRTLMQIQQLRGELRRNPELFPPEQAALLEWLVDHVRGRGGAGAPSVGRLTTPLMASLLERVSDSSLASWSEDLPAAIAARGGVQPGGGVHLRKEPARLLPVLVSERGEPWVQLSFVWPDGSRRALGEALYVSGADTWGRVHPSLVVADGAVSVLIEEPPPALLDGFRDTDGLPLPAEDRARAIGFLAARFPHLRASVAAHSRVYPVTPLVALDLRDDDWMQARVFAQSGAESWRPGQPIPAGAAVFEYTADQGWLRQSAGGGGGAAYEGIEEGAAERRAEAAPEGASPPATEALEVPAAPPAAVAEVWIERPDPGAVDPLCEWLDSTPLRPGAVRGPGGIEPRWEDRRVGWWMHAGRRQMEAFAEAWERRPSGVSFFGTERMRRLLSRSLGLKPKLRIESSGVDWLTVSAEWEAEGRKLSDEDLAQLRGATTRFVKLSSGWVRRDVAEMHDGVAEVLADLGVGPGEGTQRLTLWQLAGASPQTLERLEEIGADAATARAARRLREQVQSFGGLPEVPVPAGVTAEMRPYQRRGLDFLAYTSSLGLGAVLADDMGLGKTLQALVWLLHLRERDPEGGPSLVVCPASVVHNWAREAERFTPGLRVLLLTSGKERHGLRRQIPHHDLIVTNYALLRRDIEAWQAMKLRAVVLDEAQNIKNPDAAVSHAASKLQARHRLALTGTPLENRALDLWSIMSFVDPGYLGSRTEFQARFDRADTPPHARTLLSAKLRPVLLRRTKKAVAPELPERIEERQDCELTRGQRHLYLAELRRSRSLVEEIAQSAGGISRNKITILAALTRLRQICCHPALVGAPGDLGSGKFEALFELLEPLLAEGHKVLLFSQFVRCLKLLEPELKTRAIRSYMLTGETVKRQQIVDAFQGDPEPCVFLVSLKAGGTGLNLTAASYVILFDPWWNPAVEAQAIDRTHRIGQDRTVIAYRMLVRGTIEEKIWELQQRKAGLVRDVLGEGGFARAITREDLDFLLTDVE